MEEYVKYLYKHRSLDNEMYKCKTMVMITFITSQGDMSKYNGFLHQKW